MVERLSVFVDFSVKDYNEVDWRPAPLEEANCWSSLAADTDVSLYLHEGAVHYPCFDVDVPYGGLFGASDTPCNEWVNHTFERGDITWVRSTTPDHHHVYVDAPYTWEEYWQRLYNLSLLGIVEPGYRLSAERRHATMVRMPHVKREPRTSAPDYPGEESL